MTDEFEFQTPRIIIDKLQFDDPGIFFCSYCFFHSFSFLELFPLELIPDLVIQRSKRRQKSTPIYDDNDDDNDEPVKKRIRRIEISTDNSYDAMSVLKKKTRDRLARKVLDIDADPNENASFKRFKMLLEIFNDDYERQSSEFTDDLLSNQTLDEMANLSEKLKLSTYFSHLNINQLKHLIEFLSIRIQQGIELQTNPQDDRQWREIIFEKLISSANASEIVLNLMTTSTMSKEILVENVIEHTVLFIKSQLTKLIFPEYDPLYRHDNQANDQQLIKQKRSKITGSKCKHVQIFYNKLISLFQCITDLLSLGKYTDTIILAISSFTISCIFVENIFDLQAHAIQILPAIFSRYEHHRDSIFDDIICSLNRLPTSKKSLRSYRLSSGHSIQMFTALIMHLIQSIVTIQNSNIQDATNELQLLTSYSQAQNLAFKFLTLFFRSCGIKQGEDDYRNLFECFLEDLLIAANRPEWPSSEILLTLLSRILMKNFSNQTLPIQVRLQSLDYLGSVAAQLRKDTIELDLLNTREYQQRLETIIEKTLSLIEFDEDLLEIYRTDPLRYQRSLIIYLNDLNQYEPTSQYAKMFHLGQWIRDVYLTIERLTQQLTRQVQPRRHTEFIDDIDEPIQSTTQPSSIADEIDLKKAEKLTLMKMLTLSSTQNHHQQQRFDIDYDDICLLGHYLTYNRPFLKTFDIYLKQLAAVFQSEAGTNIRSKAMKCLCTVVESDPTILGRNDIKSCVQVGLTDKSVSVREAAIDLIGRYIVQKQFLILQYYDILCERSIDTGVSVRKRVVKIFRDICISQPNFVRLPDICSRLLRRMNDEDSIRKLVLDTFQQIWFSSTSNSNEIRRRVQIIIDVLIDYQKQNNTWLENLIKEFVQINDKQSNEEKKKFYEQKKLIDKSIQQLINELVESILKIESANDQISSNKMVATFIALYALGKSQPEYVLPHVSTVVEYLNIKCTSYNDNMIVQYVAKILEFTIPLMKSVSSSIIYSLEGSLTKLLLVSGQLVIHSSIACLASAIRLSKNYALIKEVFQRYYSFVIEYKDKSNINQAQLARSIYILGVLCKYFDFEKIEYEDLQISIDKLFELLIYFLQINDSMIQLKTLVALGYFLQRYGHYLLDDPIRQIYHSYLVDSRSQTNQLRCQVLINLEDYFRDCIRRMAEQDIEYLQTTNEELKDTTDIHSEMASSIAQCYLRVILDTYLTNDEIIRQCVRKVVTCILNQGLVHPIQFIPYLIAMTTDHDINTQQNAEQNLQDLDKTNPGIIQTKVIQGLKMSYQLQKLFSSSNIIIIRGMTKITVQHLLNQQLPFCSINHFLYSLIRTSRVYRRGLINQLLKMFEQDSTNSISLDEQLFVADNLAYFPYQVQDEPFYLIEQIDLTLSVSGSTQLQQLRELFKKYLDYIDDDEGIDMKKIEKKLYDISDEDFNELVQCFQLTRPTMLLLLLKSYLKDIYSITDTKMLEYDHNESVKITDRPIITRKINVNFEPKFILEILQPTKQDDRFEKRRQLIKDFVEFKRYLLAFDNDIEETLQSMNDLLPTKGKKKSGAAHSKRKKVMIDSDDDSTDENYC